MAKLTKVKGKDLCRYIKSSLKKSKSSIGYAFLIAIIGELFFNIELIPEINMVNFNAVCFILLIVGIAIYEISQVIDYNIKTIKWQLFNKYYQYVIFLELFLLAITCHLERSEFIVSILAIYFFEVINILIDNYNDEKDDEDDKIESDYPNGKLLPTRKKQLDNFISTLEYQKSEPYAIMISGEWGMGKSSFAKALERRLTNDSFIWVRAGSEKTVLEIMSQISEQILDILRDNNIFIEKDSLIEKYFYAFSEMFDEAGLGVMDKIIDHLGISFNGDGKDYINSKLGKLNKTIYIIIDDLDRCSDDYQLKMFKVIRESTELVNCKTIFLADRTKFIKGKNDVNYIEKYISYTLYLCEVDYKEIMNYFIECIITDDFIKNINGIILKNRKENRIRRIIIKFPTSLIWIFEKEISNYEEKTINKKIIEQEEIYKQLKTNLVEIKQNIKNTRKIKNFIKGIKRDIFILDKVVDDINEFIKEDWFFTIIQVQFVKNILPEIFEQLRMSESVDNLKENNISYIIELVFGLHDMTSYEEKEKKIVMLNYIIYSLDTKDFLQVKILKDVYTTELYSDNPVIENINNYLDCVRHYDDLYKILNLLRTQTFNNKYDEDRFIRNLFKFITQRSMVLKTNTKNFLDFSQRLIECIKYGNLSELSWKICLSNKNLIKQCVIRDGNQALRIVLQIIFDFYEVDRDWNNLPTNFDDFYELLKKYQSIDIDLDNIINDINVTFEIYEFWENIEELFDNYEDNNIFMQSFKKYFILETGMVDIKSNVIFNDIYNLKEAIIVLKEYYKLYSENHQKDFELLLLHLLYQLIDKYKEAPDWFSGSERIMGELIRETANTVCKAYSYDYKDNIGRIKILVFKFNETLINSCISS